MIKEGMVNVKITLSTDQFIWLEKQSKKLKMTKSKFIAWILSKKANEMIEYLYLKDNEYTEHTLEKMIEIIKTPWLGR